MSLLKKVSAAAAAAAIALSLASCGKDTTWGAEIDGTQIRAGIMIYFQSNSVSEARTHLTDTDIDVLSIDIDGKQSREWIKDNTVKEMREYIAVENKFKELGLSFESSELKALEKTVDQWWEYIGEYYESIGVSKQSYSNIMQNVRKRSEIFNYYYGEGGEKAVSESEIKAYLEENNVRIKFIRMPMKDGEGNLLKSDGKAELKAMAEGYIERAKGGEKFEKIEDEFNKYYNGLIAAANGTEVQEDDTADEERESFGTVVAKDSSIPSKKVAETVFDGSLKAGDYTIVEDDTAEAYFVVYKMGLFEDETFFDTQKSTVISSMKGDEFDETVKGWTESQNVVLNDAAFERYKLEKLVD